MESDNKSIDELNNKLLICQEQLDKLITQKPCEDRINNFYTDVVVSIATMVPGAKDMPRFRILNCPVPKKLFDSEIQYDNIPRDEMIKYIQTKCHGEVEKISISLISNEELKIYYSRLRKSDTTQETINEEIKRNGLRIGKFIIELNSNKLYISDLSKYAIYLVEILTYQKETGKKIYSVLGGNLSTLDGLYKNILESESIESHNKKLKIKLVPLSSPTLPTLPTLPNANSVPAKK